MNGLVCLGVERFRPIWICLFIRRKEGKKIASLAVFFPAIKFESVRKITKLRVAMR